MRKRILSILTALAVLAGLGFVGLQAATAAPSNASCASSRQWYINTNGSPFLLPWCGEAPGQASSVYLGKWLRGPKLDPDATPVTVVKPPVTSNPAGDVDPVLSTTSVGSQFVALSWIPDNPPTDQTVKGYCVRFKRTIDVWDPVLSNAPTTTTTTPPTDFCSSTKGTSPTQNQASVTFENRVLANNTTHYSVSGLLINTQYEFQVRAEYVSNSYGGWSNAVYPTTSSNSTS